MTLEDFRSAADEGLRGLEMTPERAARIAKACRAQPRRVGLGVWAAAAACFMLMAVSAGVLLHSIGRGEPQENMVIQALPPGGAVQVAGSTGQTAQNVALDYAEASILPAPVSIGEYSEGLAPAETEEQLWGYVNENGVWQVAPIYLEAGPVKDGQAVVTLQSGSQQLLFFP